jgi:fatty acid desaturase
MFGLALCHGQPVLAVFFSVAIFLAAFAFSHDVAHGALRLPRRVNELVLALSALPMLVSGHSQRLTHWRHHARPLAHDDIEGQGAATTGWRALFIGPQNAWKLRTEAWRSANAEHRRWIVAEVSACGLVAAIAAHHSAGRTWIVTCIVMALTASWWASHLPHRPPRLLRFCARRLAWTRSAVLLSFAYHDEHHLRPKVPCAELGRARSACVLMNYESRSANQSIKTRARRES